MEHIVSFSGGKDSTAMLLMMLERNWGGLYEHFDRVSCWCCPLKNNKELMQLYVYYPDLWNELKDMDNRAYNKFKGKGVDFYEKKIIQKLRNKQMSLFEE